MKKKISVIVLFIFILVFPMISWPIFAKIDNTKLEENREPTPFPKINNDFFLNFDDFFMDRIPIRNSVIKFTTNTDLKLDMFYEKILNLFDVEYYITKNNVIYGQKDWLFYTGDNSIGYYRGNNLLSEDELKKYVMRAEKVKNYFESKGKKFVIFIAPNKEQIYHEYMPKGIKVVNEIKRMDVVKTYFEQNSKVNLIYPKQVLLDAKTNDNRLYYKWDTHWNQLGAYYGVCELLKSIGEEVTPTEFTSQVVVGNKDLQNMLAIDFGEHLEYFCDYRKDINYEIFGDYYYSTTKSNNPNNKKLLFICDSFKTLMLNYLPKDFTYTTFAHRSIVRNSFDLTEINNSDIIAIEAVERFDYEVFNDNGILQFLIDYYKL